jgi:hypothetical protein
MRSRCDQCSQTVSVMYTHLAPLICTAQQFLLEPCLLFIADAPVPTSISATAVENGAAVAFTVRWADADPNDSHSVQMGRPTLGTVTGSGATWSYTPTADRCVPGVE